MGRTGVKLRGMFGFPDNLRFYVWKQFKVPCVLRARWRGADAVDVSPACGMIGGLRGRFSRKGCMRYRRDGMVRMGKASRCGRSWTGGERRIFDSVFSAGACGIASDCV